MAAEAGPPCAGRCGGQCSTNRTAPNPDWHIQPFGYSSEHQDPLQQGKEAREPRKPGERSAGSSAGSRSRLNATRAFADSSVHGIRLADVAAWAGRRRRPTAAVAASAATHAHSPATPSILANMTTKTYLVTGASRGVGLELCKKLAARPDTRVVAAVRAPEQAAELQASGCHVLLYGTTSASASMVFVCSDLAGLEGRGNIWPARVPWPKTKATTAGRAY